MIAKTNGTWSTLNVTGFLLQIAGRIIGAEIGLFLILLGTILLVAGIAEYAKAKGRSPTWGLLGLFGLIGMGVLRLIKDKSVDVSDNDSNRTEALVETLWARRALAYPAR